MRSEIQHVLSLPTLKEHWGIPNDGNSLASHNERLRKSMATIRLKPDHDFSSNDLDLIHAFDSKVKTALLNRKISFEYQGAKKARNVRAEIGGDE